MGTLSLTRYQTKQAGWNFDNSYLSLGEDFFQFVKPTKYPFPQWVIFNYKLAQDLGLAVEFFNEESAPLFSGNVLPEGAEPIAQAYAGHQFGYFTLLGDGRAILLGEQITPKGERFDIQLKGSGLTPFSRRGDGRAALGPMLREYIISECLFHLGIPTTRSLAVVATGEPVFRERILPGAVLTRIAQSHIRVGTFEYAAFLSQRKGNLEPLVKLADYTIQRHYPELQNEKNKYELFLEKVMEKQITLIVQWLSIGFIHGVMNTDNVAISGETIDFGPCAFMDSYDPYTCFSSIDQEGRYAYHRQKPIGFWNLCRFAETLLPLLDSHEEKAINKAENILEKYEDFFEQNWLFTFGQKLGIEKPSDQDMGLIQDFLNILEKNHLDFTNAFRALAYELFGQSEFFSLSKDFPYFKNKWLNRLAKEDSSFEKAKKLITEKNPAVIARNHKVEEALAKAEEGDLSYLHKLLKALKNPFVETVENAEYRKPAPPSFFPYRTFCGT